MLLVKSLFLLLIHCSIPFSLIDCVNGQRNVTKHDSYTAASKNYERSIVYNDTLITEDQIDFIEQFDSRFFSIAGRRTENVTTTADNVEQFIKCGLDVFRKLAINFEKFKTELKDKYAGYSAEQPDRHRTATVLPEAKYTYQVNITNGSTAGNIHVHYYNINITHFPKVDLVGLSYSTVDAERFANFDIHTKCRAENVTICGEHNVTAKNTVIYGTFCYKFSELVYSSSYDKYRKSDNYIVTTKLSESAVSDDEDYSMITFSIKFNFWPLLGLLHLKGLRENIASDYVWPIVERFRTAVETGSDYLAAHRDFLEIYGKRVSEKLPKLFALYAKKKKLTLSDDVDVLVFSPLENNNRIQLKLENFSKYLVVYSNSKFSDSQSMTYDVDLTLDYEQENDDGGKDDLRTAITLIDTVADLNSWHSVREIRVKFSVRIIDDGNGGAAIENVKFNFSNKIQHIAHDRVKDDIELHITKKLADFLEGILKTKQCFFPSPAIVRR